MTELIKANDNTDFQQISELANIIWSEHYTPIIGSEQVSYMLNKFQSASAIADQIKEGTKYYLIMHHKKPSGYFCISRKEDSVFLSKLYVLSQFRGQGLGKTAMTFIENKTVHLGYSKISLTVNKYNTNAIKAYEKLGFKNVKPEVQDIGNNFIMDDYLLEKHLITNEG